MASRLNVAVAVCTREDDNIVLPLISKLLTLDEAPGWNLGAVVLIVNKPDPPSGIFLERARELMTGFRPNIYVVHEPRRGIPFARNTALSWARDFGFDWLAFIDDDCQPETNWLSALQTCASVRNLDVVAGLVEVRPEKTPSPWLPSSVWGARGYGISGQLTEENEPLRTAHTRSVLFRIDNESLLSTSSLTFDTKYPFQGGSDDRFFRRYADLGGQIGFCRRSVVFETYRGERLTLRWSLLRKLRDSQLIVQRGFRPPSGSDSSYVGAFGQRLSRSITRIPNLRTGTDAWKAYAGEILLAIAPAAGLIGYLLGFRLDFYANRWSHVFLNYFRDR